VYVIKDQPCDGGVSPNAYKAQITVEMRVFFPPNTVGEDEVLNAAYDAYGDALQGITEFFDGRDQ
jgi:hypothetical protein